MSKYDLAHALMLATIYIAALTFAIHGLAFWVGEFFVLRYLNSLTPQERERELLSLYFTGRFKVFRFIWRLPKKPKDS